MENLNAEQIVNALECCTRGRKSNEDRPCLECPYNECNIVGGTSERQTKGTCQGWLMKDALALITSQEQRIKEFTQAHEMLSESYDHLEKKKDELLSERARLTEENATLHASCTELTRKCASLTEDNERLRAENEKAQIFSAFPKDEELKYLNALERMAKEYKTVRADTVKNIAGLLWQGESEKMNISVGGKYYSKQEFIDQIAKEILEGE